ncbi:MAG: serine kinase [Chlamydiae bacterium SM23_39]|nr:MAG: serine kinase [Chlamydiae bacterium SM23_39]
MPQVKDLYNDFKEYLQLKLVTGKRGLCREIKKAEVHSPGLHLTGFSKHDLHSCIFVFGALEIEYLRELDKKKAIERLKNILSEFTPLVVVADNLPPPLSLRLVCKEKKISLFSTSKTTMAFLSRMFFLLHEWFAKTEVVHGTLVEVFGLGVLIQGESSIGKSETGLGLLEKGHRLISDDVVQIKKRGTSLIGFGPELTRYIMEIRGIGIINIAHLFGAVCVKTETTIELIVHLEKWNDSCFYDRVGLEEKKCNFLGIGVPLHILPIKPGRDIILLIETLALNHRLKATGHYSAKEFTEKLRRNIKNQKFNENREKSKSEK